jgi:hypothetical protein
MGTPLRYKQGKPLKGLREARQGRGEESKDLGSTAAQPQLGPVGSSGMRMGSSSVSL